MRVNRRYINSTRGISSKMLKIYCEDTDTEGTHNLKEDDIQAHIQTYYSVCLIVCMLLFVFLEYRDEL